MPSNSSVRSLKATLYSIYLDFKTTYNILFTIMLSMMLFQMVIASLVESGINSSNASALNTGFISALWGIPISIIVMTSKNELLKKFSFPVDRKTLAFSHLAYIFLSPLAVLLTASGLYLFENIFYSIVQASNPGFFYLWQTTRESFLTGFCLTYSIIVLVSAFTYFLFVFFNKYLVGTIVAICLFTASYSILAVFRDLINDLARRFVFIDSIFEQCALYLGLSLLLIALGYIPLQRMEVKK